VWLPTIAHYALRPFPGTSSRALSNHPSPTPPLTLIPPLTPPSTHTVCSWSATRLCFQERIGGECFFHAGTSPFPPSLPPSKRRSLLTAGDCFADVHSAVQSCVARTDSDSGSTEMKAATTGPSREQMYKVCTACREPASPRSIFCAQCGARLPPSTTKMPQPSMHSRAASSRRRLRLGLGMKTGDDQEVTPRPGSPGSPSEGNAQGL
jgi:hypothetical protein